MILTTKPGLNWYPCAIQGDANAPPLQTTMFIQGHVYFGRAHLVQQPLGHELCKRDESRDDKWPKPYFPLLSSMKTTALQGGRIIKVICRVSERKWTAFTSKVHARLEHLNPFYVDYLIQSICLTIRERRKKETEKERQAGKVTKKKRRNLSFVFWRR